MYEALIMHLRECAKLDPNENTFNEAADAIENLQKIVEKADRKIKQLVNQLCNKRSLWQTWHEPYGKVKEFYSCNYCGFHSLVEYPFCPNCGADMRGDIDV